MKKLIIVLILSLGYLFINGQALDSFPISQNLGSAKTVVKTPIGGGIQGGLIPFYFADTTAANTLAPYLKSYGGALITTASPRAIWWRDVVGRSWIQVLPSAGPTGNAGWDLLGNYTADRATPPVLGNTSATDLTIITNNITRATISSDGINRENGSQYKYLVIDTTDGSNHYLGYTDGGGGGGGGGWELTGNSGVTASNFIGTLNNAPLKFKVGNVNAGQIDTAVRWNNFYGLHAGDSTGVLSANGIGNNGFGAFALRNNTTGTGNVGIGHQALEFNTTGSSNSALGLSALYSNTIGIANTGIGSQALYTNLGGSNNTAVGSNALKFNVTGIYNTALGSSALQENLADNNVGVGVHALLLNTTGYNNTSLGTESLSNNVSGFLNTAIGYNALNDNLGSYNFAGGAQSLASNTTGIGDVAVGVQAGFANTTGDLNTFIGHQTNGSTGNLSNSTALGSYAMFSASNTMALGSVFGINSAPSTTNVVIAGSTANSRLQVNGSISLPIRDTNINYALTITDNTLNATTAGRTYSLPDYSTVRGRYHTVINSSSGDITVQDVSGGSIGNYTTAITYTIPSNESVTFQAGLTGWKVSGVGGCSNCLPISDTLSMLANYWNKGDTMFLVTGALHYSYDTVTHQYTLYADTASAAVDGILLKEDWSHFDSAYNVILAGGGGGGIGGTVSNRYIPYGNGTDVLASSSSFITDGLGHVNIGPDVDTTQALQVTNNADGSNVMHLKSSDTHTDLKMTASGTSTGGTRLRASGNEFIFINNYANSATFKSDNKVRFDAYTSAIPLDTTTYKLSVMDASGNIEKMNWPILSNIYNSNGSLTGSRSVDLNFNTLSIFQGSTNQLHFVPAGLSYLQSGSGATGFYAGGDSTNIKLYNGNLKISNLASQNNATDSMMVYDPSTRAVGMRAIPSGSGGVVTNSITAKTATYTAADDYTILCSTNTFTINLPTAVGITGRVYVIKNITSGTTITVDGSGSETIDGGVTYTLASQYKYVQIQSDGTNWHVTANN